MFYQNISGLEYIQSISFHFIEQTELLGKIYLNISVQLQTSDNEFNPRSVCEKLCKKRSKRSVTFKNIPPKYKVIFLKDNR